MTQKRKFEHLAAPPAALEKGGTEILRAAIVEGGLHVTLRRAFDDPTAWGILLADIARHAARIYAAEGLAEKSLARIGEVFAAEMDNPTDTGSTSAVN